MEISGKRILITGASRGIGRALAARLAAEGARLALLARHEGPLKELAAAFGGKAFPVDLGNAAALERLIEHIEADGGGIDVLVNNAAVSGADHVLNRSQEWIETLFRVNLLAPIQLCQQVFPRMLERGSGHIVNIGSLAGIMPAPGLVHYGASKAGLAQYTAGLRVDLRDLPVTVTLVQIASTATEMDDATQSYAPYQRIRGSRSVDDVRIPLAKIVDGIVDGIRRQRRNVVLPSLVRPLTGLVEVPRRVGEFMFRNVDVRP